MLLLICCATMQLDQPAFMLMLFGAAAQMAGMAWEVAHIWPLMLLALVIWLIGCLRLYGLLQLTFPVYYRRGRSNHNTGATAPTSTGRDGVMNLAIPDEGTLLWCGYILMVTSVLAMWMGFIDGPVAAFLAYVLLLLGCGFLFGAMFAPSKPKML
ncbi:hypothetical protein ABZP36_020774 [Zizania latifolia]